MCGIFGYINWNSEKKLEEDKLINATNLLFHRGPDSGAYFFEAPAFLGHRRLSIIDIHGGKQPMFSSDGRYVIVGGYNDSDGVGAAWVLRNTLVSAGTFASTTWLIQIFSVVFISLMIIGGF